jgi:hypothetical protein
MFKRSTSNPPKWQHDQLDNYSYREEEEVKVEEIGAKEEVCVLFMQVCTAYLSRLAQPDIYQT